MSARVFVHPRCCAPPASVVFESTLLQHGFDLKRVMVGPRTPGGNRELVRLVEEEGVKQVFERMDGTRFTHRMGQIQNAPEVA